MVLVVPQQPSRVYAVAERPFRARWPLTRLARCDKRERGVLASHLMSWLMGDFLLVTDLCLPLVLAA